MATETPFTLEGSDRQSPTVDPTATLIVGSGIDASVSGPLAIGAANATSVVFAAPLTLPATQSGTIQKRTITIAFNHPDLVASTTPGDAVAIAIGAALPANSRIVGVDFRSLTPFTGGGAASVDVSIGSIGDPSAITEIADVFSAALDGGPSAVTPGARPWKFFAAPTELLATFTPDVGAALSGLTAGNITIDVMFTILP